MTQDTQTPPQPRWYEPYVHENAPRWASIQHRDDNGETLLSTSEGAGDQLRLRQFIETFTAQQQRIEALESALRDIANMAGSNTVSIPIETQSPAGFGAIYRRATALLSLSEAK